MSLSARHIATLMDCYIMTTNKRFIISSSDQTSMVRLYSLGLVEPQDNSKAGRVLTAKGLQLAEFIIEYANGV